MSNTDTRQALDMVLHCPACGMQHIDAPDDRTPDWKNEPHRSHLCHGCGHIWRPADVPTNGVLATRTKGKADSPIATQPAQPSAQGEHQCDRSRQINMDRDRLWEENGIPAAQPEPSAQSEAVAWELRAYNRTHRIVVRADVADELACEMRRQGMKEVEVRPLYASAPAAQPSATPNNDEVICPNCAHQFRAIPVNVQRLMLDAGFEPPFTAQPSAQSEAVAWLVEWKAHGYGPQWWGFNHTPGKNATWCSDANNAIRFARKEDAERMRLHIIAVAGLTGMHEYERSVSVTEHMWEGPCRAN